MIQNVEDCILTKDHSAMYVKPKQGALKWEGQCLKKLCERTAQETSASEQRQVSSGERSENTDVKEKKKKSNKWTGQWPKKLKSKINSGKHKLMSGGYKLSRGTFSITFISITIGEQQQYYL